MGFMGGIGFMRGMEMEKRRQVAALQDYRTHGLRIGRRSMALATSSFTNRSAVQSQVSLRPVRVAISETIVSTVAAKPASTLDTGSRRVRMQSIQLP